MKNKFTFKKESTAKQFAKDLEKEGEKTTVKGSSVEVEKQPTPSFDDVHEMIRNMSSFYDRELMYMYKYMDRVSSEFYEYMWEHEKGHIPAISDAGKMKEVLNTLGMGDSYEVRKPIISVASDKKTGSTILEVE